MKTCSKCGETKAVVEFGKKASARDGLQYSCKACGKVADAKWLAANPEKAKARNAKWYAENTDKKRAIDAARWAANPEKSRVQSAKWATANPEKVRAMGDRYRAANPDKVKANIIKWKASNPETVRNYWRTRRARKLGNGGNLSAGLADKLFKLQRGMCPCCGEPLGDDYHLDHIMPLSLGGANRDDNIQLLRAKCNNYKRAKHPVDFMQSRGFLI